MRLAFLNLCLFCSLTALAAAKPSLKELLQNLKKSNEISELYKSSKPGVGLQDSAKLQALLKPNQSLYSQWEAFAISSTPFWRGEIEDDSVRSSLLVLQQLGILQARDGIGHQDFSMVQKRLQPWLTFAADLSYEEASLIGLRLSPLLRSLILDELESVQTANGAVLAKNPQWLQWLNGIRAPWPVDRMILSEAKKVIRGKAMYTAQQMAIALQKNAYQTAEQALREAQGPKVPELKTLEPMWREQDIDSMRTEMNRISLLRLRSAKQRYILLQGHPPQSLQDLVTQRLIDSVPIDYHSGKAFELTQVTDAPAP